MSQPEKFIVTPIFDYLYCCLCFERLTDDNIVVRSDGKWNVCKDCESDIFEPARNAKDKK